MSAKPGGSSGDPPGFADKCTNGVCTPFQCNPVQNQAYSHEAKRSRFGASRIRAYTAYKPSELREFLGKTSPFDLRSRRAEGRGRRAPGGAGGAERYRSRAPGGAGGPIDHDGHDGHQLENDGQEGAAVHQAARKVTKDLVTRERERAAVGCIAFAGGRGPPWDALHPQEGPNPGSLAPGGPLRPDRAPGGAPGVRTGRRGRNGQERQTVTGLTGKVSLGGE